MIKLALRQIYAEGEGVYEIGTENIRSAFNNYMESELVVVEEVYGPDNRGMVNQIKAKLTEPVVDINIKGLPNYQAPNFANFIMFTNHAVPFPMDPSDRRFMMIFSYAKPKENSYYHRMVDWLKENPDTIYSWALDRDLSEFNSGDAPPVSAAKTEVIENSFTQVDDILMLGVKI